MDMPLAVKVVLAIVGFSLAVGLLSALVERFEEWLENG